MIAPHINSKAYQVEKCDSNANEKPLYLVPSTNSFADGEQVNALAMEEKLRQAHHEIARLQTLLQNFHVREQELKASFFRPQARDGYEQSVLLKGAHYQ